MLTRNPSHSGRQRGVTMIEMMVGIVVGLIVLWGMSTVYVNSARGSRTTTSANALNQDMRAVMDIMVNDIRRAGFRNSTTGAGDNPFTAATTNLVVAPNCVLYSYAAIDNPLRPPLPAPPAPEPTNAGFDFFGFRLNGNVIQTLDPAAIVGSTAGGCATDAQWQNLTDERSISVTALTFDTVGSQCLAYVRATYNPTIVPLPGGPGPQTWWQTTAAGNGLACAVGASNVPGNYAALATTDTRVETRRVRITLTARSRTPQGAVDQSLPERTLTETVVVRNNRVVVPPNL